LKRWEVWLSVILALLPSVFWYWHARNLYVTYGNTFGLLSGGDSKFGNLEIWFSPHFYVSLLRLDFKWVLGYGLILLFAVGLFFALRKKDYRIIIVGLLVVGLYYMIVARYSGVSGAAISRLCVAFFRTGKWAV
jgi:4-amino-4-deoxy-L-arabinose transferase-like glycosyltransferase